MLSAEVGCIFMGFILCISADKGLWGQTAGVCVLKGSSVDLPCSAEHPTSVKEWFTERWVDYEVVQKELSADGNRVTYNMSEGSNFTLTIKALTLSDEDVYYCREKTVKTENSWLRRIQLHVADLQVKVIPSTEGQTVTLMCSTSCPLTENPAAYIWYKNGEVLYQDWSPWYQELVGSEEAVRYSCAIKGYEDLRAPEVSVDSVTSACFNVTYAKGRMCLYEQTSEDEPCTITYPRVVHAERTAVGGYTTVSCSTSCPLTENSYRSYQSGQFYIYTESRQFEVSQSSDNRFSCAIKDNEDLLSAEVCLDDKNCWSVNYVSRRICALKGSSVNISSEYSHPDNQQPTSKSWYKINQSGKEEVEESIDAAGRVKYHDNMKNHHILRIKNLKKSDSAEYTFRLQKGERQKQSDSPGVTLVVTGLRVKFTPSTEVTEGQRVTLTCSTSCPLNTNYIWSFNSRPLTLSETQSKHLVLDPVSSQHAGNYSCSVEAPKSINSPEKTLTVQAQGKSVMIVNALKLTIVLLIPPAVILLYLMMRKKKTLTSADELSDKVQMEPLYDDIALGASTPAAQTERAEQQEGNFLPLKL